MTIFINPKYDDVIKNAESGHVLHCTDCDAREWHIIKAETSPGIEEVFINCSECGRTELMKIALGLAEEKPETMFVGRIVEAMNEN